jgi:hypothetical protein
MSREVPGLTTEVIGMRDLYNTSFSGEVPELNTEVNGRRELADTPLPGGVVVAPSFPGEGPALTAGVEQ